MPVWTVYKALRKRFRLYAHEIQIVRLYAHKIQIVQALKQGNRLKKMNFAIQMVRKMEVDVEFRNRK